jgi:4-diphosphocytidyl-2-C-methyl-D-erythritol kinase
VVVFPNCKINLGLHILKKRNDGFHDLETIFYPLRLKEALEIIHAGNESEGLSFTHTGLSLNLSSADNICVKAYQLLKNDFKELPPVKMHLHKTIPLGAGLGGGSADGAFTLLLLNKKFKLQIPGKTLEEYASRLGSDCTFFIKNKPCLASGRGEVLEPVEFDLSGYKIILVNPGIHIATAWAFTNITPRSNRISLKEIISQSIAKWKEALTNDFEIPIFKNYPEIEKIKISFYEHGAIYASMTGSGSSVYGIFYKDHSPFFDFPADYFIKIID